MMVIDVDIYLCCGYPCANHLFLFTQIIHGWHTNHWTCGGGVRPELRIILENGDELQNSWRAGECNRHFRAPCLRVSSGTMSDVSLRLLTTSIQGSIVLCFYLVRIPVCGSRFKSCCQGSSRFHIFNYTYVLPKNGIYIFIFIYIYILYTFQIYHMVFISYDCSCSEVIWYMF